MPLDGQKAVARVRLLDSTPAASYISISIGTGRTHQIRKHLASIGHPVLGDQHYGINRAISHIERSIRWQMIHAAEIKFIQPVTEKPVRCKSPLPADINVRQGQANIITLFFPSSQGEGFPSSPMGTLIDLIT